MEQVSQSIVPDLWLPKEGVLQGLLLAVVGVGEGLRRRPAWEEGEVEEVEAFSKSYRSLCKSVKDSVGSRTTIETRMVRRRFLL